MKSIRLLELELHDYTLLHLSGIQTITIDFKERFHWILGTNGSGKTSIIKESTPLPIETGNYREGGYKRSVWLVNNITYELKSLKLSDKKTVHSFCVINETGIREELNTGHTSTVYRALVLEHFGITKESHLVSIGKLKLTGMDTAARKALFTNLSSIDYTYALSYYKKLYTSFRDIQGSIKIDQGRLVELKTSSFTSDEEKSCLDEIKSLKVQAEKLMEIRPNVSDPESVVREGISSSNKALQVLFARVMDISRKNKHLYPLESEDSLREAYQIRIANFQVRETEIDEVYRKFEAATKKRETMVSSHQVSQPELVAYIELRKDLIKNLSYKYLSTEIDVDTGLVSLNEVERTFTPIKDSMVSMDPQEAATINTVQARRNDMFDLHLLQSNKVSVLAKEIETIRSHEHDPNVTCPKCSHSFNPVFSELHLKNLEVSLTGAVKERNEIFSRLTACEETLARMVAYHRGQSLFHSYIRKWPSLNDMWSYIVKEKLDSLDPFSIEHHFALFRIDLQKKNEEHVALKEIAEAIKKLDWLNKLAEDDLRKLEEDIEGLSKTLTRLHNGRKEDVDMLASLKEKVSLMAFLRTSAEEATRLKEKLQTWVRKDYDLMERSELSSFIRILDTEITTRELKLRQISSRTNEVIRLETMIAQSSKKAKALKDALKVLSPSEGLIAKGLTGFINHFTGLMNMIISRIMSYEMKIAPLIPSDDKFELDFEIPINVAGLMVNDISECSKGQAEIIDLAFHILYLKTVGLEGGIMHLDEFGTHLDFKHRHSAFEAVRQMLDTTNFSQILMVSHMSNTYGLMDKAGVTVLCPANVDIPEGIAYNETTEIKRN